MHQKARGFTLIELLVVIAIIGVIASIVMVNIDQARMKARDTKRVSDLKQLSLALELHYNEHGSYTQPEAYAADCSTGAGSPSCGTGTDWAPNSDLRDLVADGYMSALPVDPINDATYRYTYEPLNSDQPPYYRGGAAYDLCARLEGTGANYCIQKR